MSPSESRNTVPDRATLMTTIVGPWSSAGRHFAVMTGDETIDIVDATDGSVVPVSVTLSRSVAQRVSALGFTAQDRFLLVESETPQTLSRAEPTLHVIDVATGRELSRWPVRSARPDTIRLDRAAPYPERFVTRHSSE